MDELNVYISNSQCNLIECLYDEDMLCKDCIKRMIAEHDAKVIDGFTQFVKSELPAFVKDCEKTLSWIEDMAEFYKEQRKSS